MIGWICEQNGKQKKFKTGFSARTER